MVITSVYDRCGNHYCFPAGLLNPRSAGVGRGLTSELEPGEDEIKRSSPMWGKVVQRHPCVRSTEIGGWQEGNRGTSQETQGAPAE